jgi:uncharacterized protein YbjQ (UPF0145 family)
MEISTTFDLPGRKIEKSLGLVQGNTVRARWFGRDIAAGLKNLIGGEIVSYTELMRDARQEALKRMIEEAKPLGADAVIGVRFATSEMMQGSAEFLAYGTAVKISK